MDDVLAFLLNILVSSGIVVAIISFLGKWYLDKVNKEWKNKQQNEIAELKSSFQILKSSMDASQKMRIEATGGLWDSFMEWKNLAKQFLIFYEIMDESEINDLINKEEIDYVLRDLPLPGDFYKLIRKFEQKDLKFKPLVNDETWRYYSVYRGFIFRSIFRLIQARAANKKIPDWKADESTKKFLESGFSENELDYIYRQQMVVSYSLILTILEERIIFEMDKILSGESNLRKKDKVLKEFMEAGTSELDLLDLMDKHDVQLLFRGVRGGF